MKNPAAVALAKLGKGVRRNYSAEEIRKRTERLIQAREIKAARHQAKKAPAYVHAKYEWTEKDKEIDREYYKLFPNK